MLKINSKVSTLRSFLSDRATRSVHRPEGKLSFPYVTPTAGVVPGADDDADVSDRSLTGHYLQMYDWDACFFSQVCHRAGIHGMPEATVGNFLGLQGADGHIPRTVSPQRIWDGDDLAKPFFAQTLAGAPADGSDNIKLDELVNRLSAYYTYLDLYRRSKNGLYSWRNVLESGVDNNLASLAPREASKDENEAAGSFPDDRLLAADLNGYLVREFAAFAELAAQAGRPGLALHFRKRSVELADELDRQLWNDRLGLYCNLDPKTGRHVEIRSWTGLVPVLFGAARPENASRAIEENLLSEEHFLRPKGLSSVAASEPLCNQARRGLYGAVIVSNWQGPVWVLPNALAVRYLIENGYLKEAGDISLRVVTTMADALAETGTTFENYHAETGAPLWAPDFVSWNIMALELIEILD